MLPSFETNSYRRPPPWLWGRTSLTTQMLAAVGIAGSLLFLFQLTLPSVSDFSERVLYVFNHEGFHGLVGFLQGGEVSNLIIRPDGSGEISIAVRERALSAGAGNVGPAWLAALFIYAGMTRRMNASLLMLFGATLLIVTWFATLDAPVTYALIGWGAFALILGFADVGPLIKAAATLTLGIVLGMEVVGSLGYLWVDSVPTTIPLAQNYLPDGPMAPTTTPSDVKIVASAMGANSIHDARNTLIGLMVAGALLALAGIASFLRRYSNPLT